MCLHLFTALALLKVAQIVVDLFAVHVKDMRKMYHKAKFEVSNVRDVVDNLPLLEEALLDPSQRLMSGDGEGDSNPPQHETNKAL